MNIIKAARLNKNMTAKDFAAWLNGELGRASSVTPQYISSYENEAKNPRADVRAACAKDAVEYVAKMYDLPNNSIKMLVQIIK
ncbi:MAG: helix-turn-helix transcriptional regulator [Mariprofundaceae bacterium]|nr:helix-turn-helix transcriptional regulator [Mariprofundaceae bacterium]